MSNINIIVKKNEKGVWYLYDKANNKFIRPVRLTDETYKTLNPRIKTEIRDYYETRTKERSEVSPTSTISQKYEDFVNYINKNVSGQKEPVKEIAEALKGREYNNNGKPNVFFLVGPTGTGKTYFVKLTNEYFHGANSNNFIRFNCNDGKYLNPHYMKEMIYELADFMKSHPNGIVLLDEFEKPLRGDGQGNIDRTFLSPFLNIFDEGFITDREGNKVDCSNATFYLTSNLFAEQILQDDKPGMIANLQQVFSPEFFGRLTAVVPFNPLKCKEFIEATKLVLNERTGLFSIQLDKNKIQLHLDDESLKNLVLSACGFYHNIDDLMYDPTVYINKGQTKETQKLVAYHESGHAVAALAQMTAEEEKKGDYPVKKIQNLPSGSAGGYTVSTSEMNQEIPSLSNLINSCIELQAGRAAEMKFLGTKSLGWSNDKTRINKQIGLMIINLLKKHSEINPALKQSTKKNSKPPKLTAKQLAALSPDDRIQYEISQYLTGDLSLVSYTKYVDDDPRKLEEKIKELKATDEVFKAIFEAFEEYIEHKTNELLEKHKKEVELFAQAQLIKGVVTEKEIKYIWKHKKFPPSIIEFQKKSKQEQTEIKLDSGTEPISNAKGVRGIKEWINKKLVPQYVKLIETGKITPNSEVWLKINDEGKLSVEKEKELDKEQDKGAI